MILSVNMPGKIAWYMNYCYTKLHFSLLQIVVRMYDSHYFFAQEKKLIEQDAS